MTAEAIFQGFTQKRVLVIGDVMIDAYLRGSVTRVSPEAPVPIINLSKSEDRLGGAANVALNLLALGAEPILCAVIGDDKGADKFDVLLDKRNLSKEGIIRSSNRETTTKTRVIGNNQQLLRIDEECINLLNKEEERLFIDHVKSIIETNVDAIILEDYNKGLLTKSVISEIVQFANDRNIIVTVDPKKDQFFDYQNVTLFKPNLKELKEGLGLEFDVLDKPAFENAIQLLENKLNNKISFVTLSEHGVFVKENAKKDYIPAHIRNISDVSGAGDTVISVATLCLTVGIKPDLMAEIANLAGGLVCEESGVIPVNKELLLSEVQKLVLA
ncbi:MAG: bifunctional ADP-heptose synthase [Crocinitomicaceae bacterium]|nr:bifunctional ADP-heptose synthase [Crocinitomicaceae bacterium]